MELSGALSNPRAVLELPRLVVLLHDLRGRSCGIPAAPRNGPPKLPPVLETVTTVLTSHERRSEYRSSTREPNNSSADPYAGRLSKPPSQSTPRDTDSASPGSAAAATRSQGKRANGEGGLFGSSFGRSATRGDDLLLPCGSGCGRDPAEHAGEHPRVEGEEPVPVGGAW